MASLQGHREIEGAEIDDWPWPQRERERERRRMASSSSRAGRGKEGRVGNSCVANIFTTLSN